MRFKNVVAVYILLLFLASCTFGGGFSKTRAMKDIKGALKGYPVTKITMVSFEKHATLNTSYYEVRCALVLHPKACKPIKMPNHPFLFYLDQQTHTFILDKNSVDYIRREIGSQLLLKKAKKTKTYPDPWNHNQ